MSLIDDNAREKATTLGSRAKATAEREAGAQLRDAAMRGIVDRETLLDISTLPGATTREKSGQRKKRPRASSDSDKENAATMSKRSRKHDKKAQSDEEDVNRIVGVLNDMNAADAALLAEVRAMQQESTAKQDAILGKLDRFLDVAMAGQQQQQVATIDADRRREERREFKEDLMQMMVAMYGMQRPPQ